ncbi:hypothetical protein BSLG_003850 [Batrachochytrium salamandrivorans]|nr:hypothetical protein BSLG_003850 [Batrachochytrium salamandrivorans]
MQSRPQSGQFMPQPFAQQIVPSHLQNQQPPQPQNSAVNGVPKPSTRRAYPEMANAAPSNPQEHQFGYAGQQQNIQPGSTSHLGAVGQIQQPGSASTFSPMNALPPVNILYGAPQIEALFNPRSLLNINEQSVSNSPMSNPHESYQRCTLNAIPQTPALLTKSRVPLGLLITPYKQLFPNEPQVPVITAPPNHTMSPLSNLYQSMDHRVRLNRLDRPELTHGVVEFVAPQEYMVRPPQPVVMLFVIDVTYAAVQSGMVSVAAKAIRDSLDTIPNSDGRTKLGFITVDSSLHFYNLGSNLETPQMMVVSDLTETFLPMPFDLLVSLTESRAVISTFLDKLAGLFAHTQQTQLALGKALKSAQKMIGPIGGKIIVLEYSLPNLDEGALKSREDPKAFGTSKESALLLPSIGFYKSFAVDCSPMQVSIDMFLFNPQYADVATLGGCAKFTGGSIHYYPRFSSSRYEDAIKFASELGHLLSRPVGFEAVMRVRTTRGIRMKSFHGNFFLRSTDLLSLPNVSPDHSYAIELDISEEIMTRTACFQTSLLHTSSNGERRIRVLTLALPVTANLNELYSSVDQLALVSLLAKKAVERALVSKIEDARDALAYKLSELIAVYKSSFAPNGPSSQLLLPDNLKLMPVLTLAMIKNLAFRSSTTIPTDLRSYMMSLLYVFSPELIQVNMYPRFWNIDMLLSHPEMGLLGQDEQLVFPPLLSLTSEKLDRQGIYLLENGLDMFMWIGKTANPLLCSAIFGKPTPEAIETGKTTLPVLEDPLNVRVRNLVDKIRQTRLIMGTVFPYLYVVREDGDANLRMWFLSHLIEDRIEQLLSYPQFISGLKDSVGKISV